MSKEQKGKKDYWHNELKSLGIEPKLKDNNNDHESNYKEELEALTDNIKQNYYQDYKYVYSDDKIDESRFDYII